MELMEMEMEKALVPKANELDGASLYSLNTMQHPIGDV